MFVPGQFGKFPEEHSQSGIRPYMGSSLPDVESYDDLFLFRHPDHPWLLDTRPWAGPTTLGNSSRPRADT